MWETEHREAAWTVDSSTGRRSAMDWRTSDLRPEARRADSWYEEGLYDPR